MQGKGGEGRTEQGERGIARAMREGGGQQSKDPGRATK